MSDISVRHLGQIDYEKCWQKMQTFTEQRQKDSQDEIWILEHPPVFTQGQNGKPEHVLQPGTIPVIKTDRGGQVTYHGPGQLIAYTLIDIQRKNWGIRRLVHFLEKTMINLLADFHLKAEAKKEAPGVYIENKKICSLGLRVRKGCAYHGLAFNVDMDLSPFKLINPCGFSQLEMTQLADYIQPVNKDLVTKKLIDFLTTTLTLGEMHYGN